MRGSADPEQLLSTIPGIGEKTASRLHQELGVDTLEELETAAHDGRLKAFGGFGPKKLAGVIDSLATRLRRVRTQVGGAPAEGEPEVEELLDVDREYREQATQGRLRKIAPRRFNPRHEAWLPILHTTRGDRHYTALYSNTARAHQLGRTRDWVIIYLDHAHPDRQYTVVTAREGKFAGQRVVRGRESELMDPERR